MSRKLQVTELENRIAPTVITTIGQLLSMLPQGATLPSNIRTGTLNPDQTVAMTDATYAKLLALLAAYNKYRDPGEEPRRGREAAPLFCGPGPAPRLD